MRCFSGHAIDLFLFKTEYYASTRYLELLCILSELMQVNDLGLFLTHGHKYFMMLTIFLLYNSMRLCLMRSEVRPGAIEYNQ